MTIFFVGVMKASQILRRVSADLAGEAPVGATESGGRQLDKPVVTDRPILWKERHFHELLPKTKAGRRVSQVAGVLLGYIPAIVILVAGIIDWPSLTSAVSSGLNGFLPLLVWVLVCAGLRISGGVIARERERDTLTSLIMTPIPPAEILRDKWLGSLLAQRGGFIWILMLGLPAIVTGLYPWWAFLGLFLLTVSYQCAGTSIGVLASVAGTKVEKANQNAVLRGLIGSFIQAMLAIVPIVLSATAILPAAKYATILVFPLGALIGLGLIKECPAEQIPYWCFAGILGALHMFLIAWLVYRRAVRKFERMCAEGTVDTGGPAVR